MPSGHRRPPLRTTTRGRCLYGLHMMPQIPGTSWTSWASWTSSIGEQENTTSHDTDAQWWQAGQAPGTPSHSSPNLLRRQMNPRPHSVAGELGEVLQAVREEAPILSYPAKPTHLFMVIQNPRGIILKHGVDGRPSPPLIADVI